jgi:hypothetical protein
VFAFGIWGALSCSGASLMMLITIMPSKVSQRLVASNDCLNRPHPHKQTMLDFDEFETFAFAYTEFMTASPNHKKSIFCIQVIGP